MRFVVVWSLAIIAVSFAAPIDNTTVIGQWGNESTSIYFSNLTGGMGGEPFAGPTYADLLVSMVNHTKLPKIISFGIRGDKRVDQINYDIAFPNGSVARYIFGGEGGDPISLLFNDGESISKVVVQFGGRSYRRGLTSWIPGWLGSVPEPEPEGPGTETPVAMPPMEVAPHPDGLSEPNAGPDAGQPETGGVKVTVTRTNSDIRLTAEQPFTLDQPLTLDQQMTRAYRKITALESDMRDAESRLNTIGTQNVFMAISIVTLIALNALTLGLVLPSHHHPHNSQRLYYLQITTNLGRTIKQGTQDGNPVSIFTPPDGFTELVGFVGRSGDEVDAIGPVWA